MNESGRRRRRRWRDGLRENKGKTVGIISVAAPVVGFIVNDLKRPDSIVRNLARIATAKLLPARSEKRELVDITDQVEVIDENHKE
jgi:hypothetical protein